jgi:hypothetical protein
MSSAEARDRFVAALLARLFSDEQLRILREARVEYGDGPHALESAADVVTAQEVGESITLMLEANRSLLNEEILTELGKIVGIGRAVGEYVPMRREQINKALRLTDGKEQSQLLLGDAASTRSCDACSRPPPAQSSTENAPR